MRILGHQSPSFFNRYVLIPLECLLWSVFGPFCFILSTSPEPVPPAAPPILQGRCHRLFPTSALTHCVNWAVWVTMLMPSWWIP